MIQLTRSRNLQDIPPSLQGQLLLEKEQALIDMMRKLKAGLITKKQFEPGYWGKAKKQLKKESFDKCAYCESPTAVVAHGDVEHYRPKNHYWWLAYCYDNYLFSCQICNQTNKGDKFPFSATSLTEPDIATAQAGTLGVDPLAQANALTAFHQLLVAEKADLPNPYYDDPTPYFIWQADDVVEEVVVAPNPAHPESVRVMRAVVDCLDLNRRELRSQRYKIFANFRLAKRVSQQPGDFPVDFIQMALNLVSQMKKSQEPYAGMIRYFDSII